MRGDERLGATVSPPWVAWLTREETIEWHALQVGVEEGPCAEIIAHHERERREHLRTIATLRQERTRLRTVLRQIAEGNDPATVMRAIALAVLMEGNDEKR